MKRLFFVILAIAVCFSCTTPEQKTDPLVVAIDSVMTALVDTARFNGNVLVAKSGKVVYQKNFGLANFYTGEKLNDSSLFDLASVSKAFTSMAIMMLKEEGKLGFDDDVRKFLPELPYEGMTIRHFLTHTSGIPDYEELMMKNFDNKKIASNADVLKMLSAIKPPINFKPGEKWRYSNTAYAMLATIVERVSGEKFGSFLDARIFKPLSMSRTRVYITRRSGEVIDNYAYGFVLSDSLQKYVLPDSLKEFTYVYTLDGIQGDGVVNSTTPELFKWNEALYTDKLVSPATLQEAFTSAKLNNDSICNYGFGWFLENDSIDGKIVRHTGSWTGYRTLLVRFLDSKDCIIILTNTENPSARTTAGQEIRKRLRWARVH